VVAHAAAKISRTSAAASNLIDGRWPTIGFVLRVGALVGCYAVLNWWVRQVSHLPAGDYFEPALVGRLSSRLVSQWYVTAPLIALGGLSWLRDHSDWHSLDGTGRLRFVVVAAALVVAWSSSAYPLNLYFDQLHAIDRLLIVALAAGCLWRPQFLLLFVIEAHVIAWQFDYPLVGHLLWPESAITLRVLVIVSAFLYLRTVDQHFNLSHVLVVLLAMMAAQYFGPALEKLKMAWLTVPHLHLNVYGAYAIGWLGSLPPQVIASLSLSAQPVSLLMMTFAVAVELASLLILANRCLTRIYFFFTVGFHVLVMGMIGITFWKWALFEAVMLAAIPFWQRAGALRYDWWRVLLSIPLVASGVYWARPPTLSWYDTHVTYQFVFEAHDAAGHTYVLSPSDFAPYADTFTMRNFGFLSRDPQLTHPYGVTGNRDIAVRLRDIRTAADAAELERTLGEHGYDSGYCHAFDDFLRRFLRNWHVHGSARPWFSPLSPPGYLLTWTPASGYDGAEPITTVRIYEQLWLAGDQGPVLLRRRLLREVAIDAA
jgi:hypothetical protein